MINGNEKESKNDKIGYIDTTQIDLDLDIDTNILYIKCVSV